MGYHAKWDTVRRRTPCRECSALGRTSSHDLRGMLHAMELHPLGAWRRLSIQLAAAPFCAMSRVGSYDSALLDYDREPAKPPTDSAACLANLDLAFSRAHEVAPAPPADERPCWSRPFVVRLLCAAARSLPRVACGAACCCHRRLPEAALTVTVSQACGRAGCR